VSRVFPAIDVGGISPPDEDEVGRWLAVLDDCRPTAVEEIADGVRVFFGTPADRDRALATLQGACGDRTAHPVNVPDEQWAERTQAAVRAIRVGDVVVAPPWDVAASGSAVPSAPRADGLPDASRPGHLIVIQPSMGFGTGHHASTRLCLHLLQAESVVGASVLDVGTGSGVLALAAWRLGATRVLGIDLDADAVAAARENLALNGAAGLIDLEVRELLADVSEARAFDVITANLTGATIERHAAALTGSLRSGGRLLVSGFRTDEEDAVNAALHVAGLVRRERRAEEDWVGVSCELRGRN
jgi:ribosomal protein L11 methyltransferase